MRTSITLKDFSYFYLLFKILLKKVTTPKIYSQKQFIFQNDFSKKKNGFSQKFVNYKII